MWQLRLQWWAHKLCLSFLRNGKNDQKLKSYGPNWKASDWKKPRLTSTGCQKGRHWWWDIVKFVVLLHPGLIKDKWPESECERTVGLWPSAEPCGATTPPLRWNNSSFRLNLRWQKHTEPFIIPTCRIWLSESDELRGARLGSGVAKGGRQDVLHPQPQVPINPSTGPVRRGLLSLQ